MISVLLHLVVFWPEPYARSKPVKATPLSVRFAPREAAQRDVKSDCCEALSRRGDDFPASSAKGKGRQRVAAEVRREREMTANQRGVQAMPPVAIENALPATAASERIGDVMLLSDEGLALGASLARYRLSLAAAAVRMQTYPQAAMAAGLEGTVLVDVRLATKSVPPSITVGRSSGSEELDREAVLLLTRAMMTLPAWQAAAGEGAAIRLPVSFELQAR